MLEAEIIEFCSPTLAGLKTAGLFNYRFQEIDILKSEVFEENRKLNEKGVFIELLKIQDSRALVYVYRREWLERDLMQKEAQRLLEQIGYSRREWRDCLEQLKERLGEYESFPHEIGLFLGYPFQDVIGFIEQKGRNYKCAGFWKVYGDETEMRKLFYQLKKCREIYGRLFSEGRTIFQLTVAA
ncbi:MAG: DUF3793 family protein [Clostridium sp.]|nr:DUF3793 family protein [Clostridium sp.]